MSLTTSVSSFASDSVVHISKSLITAKNSLFCYVLVTQLTEMIKSLIVRYIPPRIRTSVINELLLRFPTLYRSKFINFESQLWKNHGIEDLITMLNSVLNLEGNIIECGSFVCGSALIIANHLRSTRTSKKVYALDLFGGGFDLDELEAERRAGLTQARDTAFTHTTYDYVKKKLIDSVSPT